MARIVKNLEQDQGASGKPDRATAAAQSSPSVSSKAGIPSADALLPETRAFLRDWLNWAENGAPDGKPYRRAWGLCSNAPDTRVLFDLKTVWGSQFPFGSLSYFIRGDEQTQHECPKRLAFARANAAAPA